MKETQTTQPINMDVPILLAGQLKEFEAKYVETMLLTKDKVAQAIKTDSDQKKYNELEEKCIFLQNFVSSIRECISIVGVTGGFGEDYLRTVTKFKIGETDELFSEQKSEILRLTEKSEKLFGYISES